MRRVFFILHCFYMFSLSSAVFYTIDTTQPLQCSVSSQFQNRVMVEGGRIKKVVCAESERISIQMEEISGQAFLYAREVNPQETTVSIVTDAGVVQDIQLRFTNCISEVIVLKESISEDPVDEEEPNNDVLEQVDIILSGNIPHGYIPCSIAKGTWKPKKGILFEPVMKLEGKEDFIYVYRVTNRLKRPQTLVECELECRGCNWVYLEQNVLRPKKKLFSIISVAKYE